MAQTSLAMPNKAEPDSAADEVRSPLFHQEDAGAPPGWTYNPSDRRQRLSILVLALLNCSIAGYLAVCQIKFHGNAWDPFFGDGASRVLTSSVSRAFPVSDAALGAAAYLAEAIFDIIGDRQRWRTSPWLVLAFGLLVLPLSFASIALMILQPVLVHAWCSLCLLQAAGMVLIVGLSLDEVVAAVQFLVHSYRLHSSLEALWSVFLHGEPSAERNAGPARVHVSPSSGAGLCTGFRPTWSLAACLALGLGCLIAPSALHVGWNVGVSLYVVGALTIALSTLAMAEIARILRFALVPGGLWLLVIAPWNSPDTPAVLKVVEMLAGGALVALSYRRGRIDQCYGDWSPL